MLLLVFFISCFGVIQTHGQCDFTPLKSEVSVLGTKRSYCEYAVKDGVQIVNLKVLQGATFNTLDCHTCSCNQYGMRCCPSNKDPRTIRVPQHCKIIMDGCNPTVVRKSDNVTDCYSARPVTVVRQQRQRMNKVYNTINQIDRYQRQQRQRGREPMEGNEVMMLLALSGALDGFSNGPYSPVASTGSGMGGSPFDFNTMMMFSMMGS